MNRIVFFVIIAALCSCNTNQNKITEESPKHNVEKPVFSFIGQDLRSEIEGDLKYETLQTIITDFNKDELNDTILIERIARITVESGQIYEWDEAGDFHRIKVKVSGNDTRTFTNINGWVGVERLFRYDNNLYRENVVSSNNILVFNADSKNILVLIAGYPYASRPGLLTILNIYQGESTYLIFNDNIELLGFKDFDGDGTKDLITTVWDGFYKEEDKNKYRHKVYLLNGGLNYSPEYSKIFCEEYHQ